MRESDEKRKKEREEEEVMRVKGERKEHKEEGIKS